MLRWLLRYRIVRLKCLVLPDSDPVLFLLAIGFPGALILAWFFELTMDGLIKSADLAQHEVELRTFHILRFRQVPAATAQNLLHSAISTVRLCHR